eukprot:TRINITY_DN11208_c0_g1_i2.p1 TRINITY_DN11208_c0_g1~~TRINITY_DN11208_c0_g1_i2.p1  ORF type:complete len:707 (+),score=77.96 TRINITY_DN11208_c0_g1_i2:98-2122(+)
MCIRDSPNNHVSTFAINGITPQARALAAGDPLLMDFVPGGINPNSSLRSVQESRSMLSSISAPPPHSSFDLRTKSSDTMGGLGGLSQSDMGRFNNTQGSKRLNFNNTNSDTDQRLSQSDTASGHPFLGMGTYHTALGSASLQSALPNNSSQNVSRFINSMPSQRVTVKFDNFSGEEEATEEMKESQKQIRLSEQRTKISASGTEQSVVGKTATTLSNNVAAPSQRRVASSSNNPLNLSSSNEINRPSIGKLSERRPSESSLKGQGGTARPEPGSLTSSQSGGLKDSRRDVFMQDPFKPPMIHASTLLGPTTNNNNRNLQNNTRNGTSQTTVHPGGSSNGLALGGSDRKSQTGPGHNKFTLGNGAHFSNHPPTQKPQGAFTDRVLPSSTNMIPSDQDDLRSSPFLPRNRLQFDNNNRGLTGSYSNSKQTSGNHGGHNARPDPTQSGGGQYGLPVHSQFIKTDSGRGSLDNSGDYGRLRNILERQHLERLNEDSDNSASDLRSFDDSIDLTKMNRIVKSELRRRIRKHIDPLEASKDERINTSDIVRDTVEDFTWKMKSKSARKSDHNTIEKSVTHRDNYASAQDTDEEDDPLPLTMLQLQELMKDPEGRRKLKHWECYFPQAYLQKITKMKEKYNYSQVLCSRRSLATINIILVPLLAFTKFLLLDTAYILMSRN